MTTKVSVHFWEAVWKRSWAEVEIPDEVSHSAIGEYLQDTADDWLKRATVEEPMVVQSLDTEIEWEEVTT